MNRLAGKVSVAVIAVSVAAILFAAAKLRAQQAPGTTDVKQEVPDNPAAHEPPEQPLPYSHKTHLALGLDCTNCHTNPEPGNLMTFPATTKWMGCHRTKATNKPSIQKLTAYWKSGETILWVRVYKVLPGVTWSHRKHLAAGIKCQMCYGQVAEIDRMSEATSVTTMGVCLNCHKDHGAPSVCATCHSWPPAN